MLELELAEQTCRELDEANLTENEHLDQLVGLERLVRLQRQRVEGMMKEELEKGIRHPNLSKDLQSFAALSKVLTKEKEFALRHPGDDPIRKKEEQLRDRQIDANFKTFIANTSDETRDGLIRAANRFLELAAKRAVSVVAEKDENGKIQYVPIKQVDP